MKNILERLSLNYFIIFFFTILLFIYTTGQLTDVYIRHDDWEFMTYLLPNMPNHGTPWDKTLWEGRWINYLWSFLAKELSVNENYILFILGYSFFSWISAFTLSKTIKYRFLLSFIIFLCPAYADLSFWPATLTPSVWIAALGIGVYYIVHNKIILFLFFMILPMAYAPLLPVCFLLVSVHSKNTRELYKLGALYYSAYVIGVLFIYSVNYIFHNKFGVNIADWRHANPVQSLQDIYYNINKVSLFWQNYISTNLPIVSMLTILLITLLIIDKDKTKRLALSLAIAFCFDFTLYVYSGVDIPDRSVIWPWFFFLISISTALESRNNFLKLITFLLYILVFFNGITTWRAYYHNEVKHARFENNLSAILKSQSRNDVYICGNIKNVQGYNLFELRPLTLSLWKKEGIVLHSYSGDECNSLPDAIGIYNLNNKTFFKIF